MLVYIVKAENSVLDQFLCISWKEMFISLLTKIFSATAPEQHSNGSVQQVFTDNVSKTFDIDTDSHTNSSTILYLHHF